MRRFGSQDGRCGSSVGCWWAVFDALAQGAGCGPAGRGGDRAGQRARLGGAGRDWAEAAVPAGLCVAWLAFAGMTAVDGWKWC